MVELVVLGALALAAFIVIGSLVTVFSMVGWVISLPFRLVGLVFMGLGLLIVLPLLMFAGLIAAIVLGVGALFALVPLLPAILLVMGIVWLVRHRSPRPIPH